MNKIYADNASTSFPKPKEMGDAVFDFLTHIGTNVGRGNYQKSYSASRIVYETRELICELFNYNNPFNVVFTSNITESLNIIIKGYLSPGDHVLVTAMEHNAVIRPLEGMKKIGIDYSIIDCDSDGFLLESDIEKNIRANTKLVIINHVSNVSGSIQPIELVSSICKKQNIPYVIDSAQSAGILPLDFFKLNLSALPFTGHKGLLGPQGTGGLILADTFAAKLRAFKEGGTGSHSEDLNQPIELPDKFESGTMNIPGIYGLNASLKFIKQVGIDNIYEHEKRLSEVFLCNLLNVDGIKLNGSKDINKRTGVFSITFSNIDASEAAYLLDENYGIMTRCGIHCSPLAHKTLGTFPEGTVRFSFGYFNTLEEVNYISRCIDEISRKR